MRTTFNSLRSSIQFSIDLLPVDQSTPALYYNPASNTTAVRQSTLFIYYILSTITDVFSSNGWPSPKNPCAVTPSQTWVSSPRKLSKLTAELSRLSTTPLRLGTICSDTSESKGTRQSFLLRFKGTSSGGCRIPSHPPQNCKSEEYNSATKQEFWSTSTPCWRQRWGSHLLLPFVLMVPRTSISLSHEMVHSLSLPLTSGFSSLFAE